METRIITVIALVVVLKLYTWGQMIYWSDPTFREDFGPESGTHEGMRHA